MRNARTPELALRRMQAGTGFSAIKVDDRTFRLVAVQRFRQEPRRASAPEPEADIVITASKRDRPRGTLPGQAEVVSFTSPLGARDGRGSVGDLATQLPSLSTTALGRGRNKLFLRGIADSSFSGKTEAVLGEYLGEARINYNAPDPGLLLYDVKTVELLKGPQGTLYGGGTLSGILRIEPERPDLRTTGGFVDLAGSATRAGAPSYAAAAMLNLPITEDRAGLRLLACRRRDGGYIDDAGRNLQDVNRSVVDGGRAQFEVSAGGWAINLLGAYQRISSADSNYADAAIGPLGRASEIAQPSRNVFGLVDVEVRGALGGIKVVSTTSVSRNVVEGVYDASSRGDARLAFVDHRTAAAFNQETRFSRSTAGGAGWVAGLSVYGQKDANTQQTARATLINIDGNVRTDQLDLAAFGQLTVRRGPFLLTGGVRATSSSGSTTTPLQLRGSYGRHRSSPYASPMADVTWSRRGFSVSLGYREGWRPGGAAIARLSDQQPDLYLVRYRPDHVRAVTLSAEYQGAGRSPFALQATLSGVDWDHIQSSTLDTIGLVYTSNSDSADLLNLDLNGSWKPRKDLLLRAGISLTRAFSDSFMEDERDRFGSFGVVPSVPGIAAFGSMAWTRRIARSWQLGVEGRVAYTGRSRLGLDGGYGSLGDAIGGFANPRQGDVLSSQVALRLTHGRYSGSLEIENLADDRASLFAYGNGFTLARERQRTPQRPRTVTLGLNVAF